MPSLSLTGIKKIMLFGGGDRLVEACALARAGGFDVRVVASRRHLAEPLEPGHDLQAFLERENFRFLDCADCEAPEVLAEINAATLGLSLGAPWIFRREFIDRFAGRLLNLHSTPLPRHRGGGGYSWMILMGERRGASLLHQVTAEVDAGPVVLRDDYEFPQNARIPADYFQFAKVRDFGLLKRLFNCCREGRVLETRVQDEAAATYFPRLNTDLHGFVDWRMPASDIMLFICAFDEPYAGASTFWDRQRVYLKNCRPAEIAPFHPFQSGLVYRIQLPDICIAAPGRGLIVGRVLDAAGNDLAAQLRPGARFHTPQARLDRARQSRAVYTPRGLRTARD